MNAAPDQMAPGRFLSIADVVRETSLSEATIRRKVRDGSFPRPRALGPLRKFWTEREVEQWKAEILAASG